MRDEKSLLTAKKSDKARKVRCIYMIYACRVCGVNFKISVGDYGGTTKYISTGNLFKISEWTGVDKIRLAILLKIHCGAEVDPQNGKSSRERETAYFCSRFNTDPPRLEADRRSKSKQSPGNSSEIDAILH